MNVRHPMGILHAFSIKNILHDKIDLRLFCFRVTKYCQINELKKRGKLKIYSKIKMISYNTYVIYAYQRTFSICNKKTAARRILRAPVIFLLERK